MKQYYQRLAALSLLSSPLSSSSFVAILPASSSPTPTTSTNFSIHSDTKQSITKRTTTRTIMTMSGSTNNRWSSAWEDIRNGGNPRWKITSEDCHEKAYAHFQKFVLRGQGSDDDDDINSNNNKGSVLCPLAGDDPFVHLLYEKGYSVTAIDLVAEAIEAMKERFGDGKNSCWTKEEHSSDGSGGDDIVWKHESGRVTLIVGDALKKRPNLNNSFDAVYDKDSFGALPKQLRKPFCQRISEYTKDDGILYLECKLKQGVVDGRADDSGPPFLLQREDLMEDDNYGGSKFEYVEGLGSVYDLPNNMNAMMQQTGHVLRRRRSATATAAAPTP